MKRTYGPKPHPLASAKLKFSRQRAQARYRNIDFDFTFDDWYAWWLSHGVDKNIDTFDKTDPNRLCMCRYGDQGAYTPTNVYCATHIQNSKDKKYYPVQQRIYQLGKQAVTRSQVLVYLNSRGISHSYLREFTQRKYHDAVLEHSRRYIKRFRLAYGNPKHRRWFEGATACYSTRRAAAESYGISVDLYIGRTRRGVPGYSEYQLGDIRKYLKQHLIHPDGLEIVISELGDLLDD